MPRKLRKSKLSQKEWSKRVRAGIEAARLQKLNPQLDWKVAAGAASEQVDNINPSHYKKHPTGIECIEIAEHFNFNRGNAIKYIWRADEKGSVLENLRKAQWYLNREIERLEKEMNT